MTTVPLCACGQLSPDAVLCRTCGDRLKADLHRAAEAAADLDDAAWPVIRGGGGRPTRRVPPLPFDPEASDAAAQLRNTLSGWCRVIIDTRPDAGAWPRDTVPSMARWLLERMAVVRQHEAAADIADEVHEAVKRAVRAADRRPHGAVPDGPRPLEVAARSDVLGTPGEIASALEAQFGITVAPSTIRVWAARRRIEPRPGPRGTAVYRVGDVVELCTARRD